MVAVAAVVTASLAACTPGDPATAPPPAASSPAAAPSASSVPEDSEPSAPALVPDGTAADNLPVFAAVTAAVWATDDRVAGRAYVDALVQAGFDRSAMQVTHDRSTVGDPAESIQFSVRWGQECLIGQVGPATGEPVTTVMPVLAEGACLIGNTRPIDW
jgi:hypothetical protein